MASSASRVSLLPKHIGSLSHTVPPALSGTLFVLGSNGGMSVAPDAGFTLLFGRNEPDVHICVGAGDTRVSRRQGLITRESSRWMLHNTGRLPIRFPDRSWYSAETRRNCQPGTRPCSLSPPGRSTSWRSGSPLRHRHPAQEPGRGHTRRRRTARYGS